MFLLTVSDAKCGVCQNNLETHWTWRLWFWGVAIHLFLEESPLSRLFHLSLMQSLQSQCSTH